MQPSVPYCGDKTLVQCIDAGWALADAGVENWPFSSLFGMPAGSQQFPCVPIPNLWSAQSGVGGKSGRSLWPSEIERALGLKVDFSASVPKIEGQTLSQRRSRRMLVLANVPPAPLVALLATAVLPSFLVS